MSLEAPFQSTLRTAGSPASPLRNSVRARQADRPVRLEAGPRRRSKHGRTRSHEPDARAAGMQRQTFVQRQKWSATLLCGPGAVQLAW